MSPPVFIASNTVPLPPDNHPDNGILSKWWPVLSIPGSTDYYLIKITGKISHDWNELCPVSQCPNTWDGVSMGPAEGAGGRVDLGHASPGTDVAGGALPTRWYPKEHPDGNGTAFILSRAGSARTVWARRSGLGTGCLKSGSVCDPNNRQPQYFLSGQQTITLHSISEPVGVTGPTAVAPGQPGAFSATIVENLPADLDANGNKRIFWYYQEGDTLATPGGGTTRNIIPCNTTAACSYTPLKSGRVRVTAYVQGLALTGYSDIVRVQKPKLVLDCPSSVERAGTINCTVSAQPTAPLTEIQWVFVDTAGHTITGPAETISWGGIMVVGGTMKVSAQIATVADTADATIQVLPRTWSSPVPSRNESFARCLTITDTCRNLYPPTALAHLGTHVFQPRGINLVARAATVPDGPNLGWSYLSGTDSPAAFTEHRITINDVLNPLNVDQVNQDFWAGEAPCDRDAMLAHVTKHERHHADMYDQNRHLIDAEAESLVGFMTAADWAQSLGFNGANAIRITGRISLLSGGSHLATDGFDFASPCPDLLN